MPLDHPPQPFQPVTPKALYQRAFWLLPIAFATLVVVLIGYGAEVNDAHEHTAYRNTLAADAHSVVAQLTGRQDFEKAKLQEVAARVGIRHPQSDVALQSLPEVVSGLDRLWNRLVWIDDNNQVLARAERRARTTSLNTDELKIQSSGQADHFVMSVQSPDGKTFGKLLARYEITELLQSTDLAWLVQRYQVDFLSELGEVIATTARPGKVPQGSSMEVPLTSFKDTTLRLTPYSALDSWRHNSRTLALLGGLLVLGAAASHLLRREMARVARAVEAAQTEAAWRQSMEDSALVGLRARDHSGRILYVNKTLCEMVGYTREELIGLIPPLPFWPDNAIDALMAQNMNTLAGDAPTEGFETRWRHKDGHLLDVMIFESALVNPSGLHVGWMGSIVDISERKSLEEKERRHVEVQAQHARLNDLGLIASELAHEINQPLTTIVSYSAGLNLALRKRLPDDANVLHAVDEVHKHATKAGDIVNWIRRQSSRSDPVRVQCDINTIVQASVGHRSRALQRTGIRLQLDLGENLPSVTVDRIGIEQVIANLLRNAADAQMGPESQVGEKLIRVTTRRHTVADASNTAIGQSVEVLVQDNGPGLQGKTMEVLGSTFYSTKQNGMGLGLGICRSIAESHAGQLSATDVDDAQSPCHGAQFCLTLPASPQPPQGATP